MTEMIRILNDAMISFRLEEANDNEIVLAIEWGDWKHDHARVRYLARKAGYTDYIEVIDEDDSDCYSAIHTLVKGVV